MKKNKANHKPRLASAKELERDGLAQIAYLDAYKPRPQRRNLSFIVTMPPLEKQRLTSLARKLGRPVSWVVRDAVRAYAEAAGPNVDALARKLAALDISAGAHVPLSKTGRPPKPRRSKSDKKP